jgi:DNA-binding beta-propeller fold protein YncE
VVVDPAGNVVGGHSGEGVYEVLAPVVTSLVAEFDENGILMPSPPDFVLESDGLPQTILSFPGKVHADPEQDRIFIADTNHNRIVVARISDGEVLDVFGSGRAGYDDGAALRATFDQPQGMALDRSGRYLYVADVGNHAIRTIDLDDRSVATLVGTGSQAPSYPPAGGMGVFAELSSPWDVTRDGDTLYVAMAGSHQIFSVDLETSTAVAFAGNGRESTRNGRRQDAELAQPSGVALDGAGRLYFADSESSSIRYAETDPEGGDVDVIAGSDANLFDFGDEDGVATEARLQHPLGVSFLDGTLYFTDTYNSKIKAVDPDTEQVTTLFGGDAGWQDGADPLFYEPGGLHAVDGKLYVADTNNHAVRIVDLATGTAETLLLAGIERFNPAPGDAEYTGTVIVLDEITAAEGEGTIVLDVTLPDGYKVNEQAPSSMEWRAEGDVAEFAADAGRSLTGVQFPQEVGVTYTAGSGEVTGDITIIWCSDDAESLCFIEQLRVTVPVTVGATGESTITISHEITLPTA